MAFAIKLTAMKWDQDGYSSIEVPGEISDRHISSDDPRFRRIDQTAGYLDYFAILSPKEAREIAAAPYKGLAPAWEPDKAMSKVEDALEDSNFVVAHLFEWDSGLG